MEKFPSQKFEKSCLLYTKNNYGIFYLTGNDGNNYTVKIMEHYGTLNPEIQMNLYIKKYASHIPNLLMYEGIYKDINPNRFSLFSNKIEKSGCKDYKIEKIFTYNHDYTYFLTKACLYNLGFFFGTYKGKISYQIFINYTFEIMIGLQTLHSLNIWHRDLKPANILLCEYNKITNYKSTKYVYGDKSWVIFHIDNKYMKIIDFGESIIAENVSSNHCQEFRYEVNVGLLNIIQIMWKNIDGDKNIDNYEDLIAMIKNCKTNVLDIILNVKLFDNLISDKNTDLTVKMLQISNQ